MLNVKSITIYTKNGDTLKSFKVNNYFELNDNPSYDAIAQELSKLEPVTSGKVKVEVIDGNKLKLTSLITDSEFHTAFSLMTIKPNVLGELKFDVTTATATYTTDRLWFFGDMQFLPKPEINCTPSSAQTKTTTVTHDGEVALLTYVTISRNGGAPITYVLQSNEAPPEDVIAAQFYAQDGSSIAFVDYPGMFSTNSASSGSVCGISTTGEVIASGESISLIGKEIYTNNGPATITGVRAEHNWVTVMPTANVPRDQDIYYLAYVDSDTQDSITINSCAALIL